MKWILHWTHTHTNTNQTANGFYTLFIQYKWYIVPDNNVETESMLHSLSINEDHFFYSMYLFWCFTVQNATKIISGILKLKQIVSNVLCQRMTLF